MTDLVASLFVAAFLSATMLPGLKSCWPDAVTLAFCRGIAPSLALRRCTNIDAALQKDDEPEKNHQNDRHDMREHNHG